MVMSRVYERPKFWPSPTPIKGYKQGGFKVDWILMDGSSNH